MKENHDNSVAESTGQNRIVNYYGRYILRRLMVVLLILPLSGCHYWPFSRDPLRGPYPYKIVLDENPALPSYMSDVVFVDLNQDGLEESMTLSSIQIGTFISSIHLFDYRMELVQQINFAGKLRKPAFFDWTGDDRLEIFVPFCRHDTVFLRILDMKGNILLSEKPLFTGKPRVDSSAVYEWTGNVFDMRYLDLEHDGRKELVVFPSEGLARAPRGVFVYDGQTLDLKWKYEIGPAINSFPILDDLNSDEQIEILLATSSPVNGNRANGTSDEYGYLFMLNAQGEMIRQEKLTGPYGGIAAQLHDFDHDGKKELLLKVAAALDEPRFRLEMRDPWTLRIIRQLPLSEKFSSLAMQMDRQPDLEIAVLLANGNIRIYDAEFNLIRERSFPSELNSIVPFIDINDDGLPEFVVIMNRILKRMLLDHSLKPLALLPLSDMGNPEIDIPQQYYHSADGKTYFIHIRPEGVYLGSIVPNAYYRLELYGPFAGLLLGIGFLGGLVYIALRNRSQARFLRHALEIGSGLFEMPLMILDGELRVIFSNGVCREFCGLKESRRPQKLERMTFRHSAVRDFLLSLRVCDPVQQKLDITLEDDRPQRLRLLAEPFWEHERKRPYWIFMIQNLTQAADVQQAHSWAAMAQRVAHDLKNPLSSILLTLQRLQREYQERVPEVAPRLDAYAQKIEERIESMRRMTRGFMKFLNLEKLRLEPTDVNAFIERFLSSGFIEIPSDIEVQKKFADALPEVPVDTEQLQTVLENLIENAINAMPDGGKLTIATQLEKEMVLPGHKAPQDFVVIEILDTGKGIPESMMNRLFEPYVRGSASGTGLGLAIVKKIVEDHGGRVDMSSELGVGTVVTLYLPVRSPKKDA